MAYNTSNVSYIKIEINNDTMKTDICGIYTCVYYDLIKS